MKSYLIVLLFLSSHFSFSQMFISFPDSNASWINTTCPTGPDNPHCDLVYRTNYCIGGDDTLIGTNLYSKVDICNGSYYGALRDDGMGRVYFIPKDSTSEFILYNFNVSVGDTVMGVYSIQGGVQDRIIQNIDSLLIFGQYHKQIDVNYGDAVWIEGIGSSAGLFKNYEVALDAIFYLECMSYNDTIYYPNENLGNCQLDLKSESFHKKEINISPNPSTLGYVMVELPSIDIYTYQIYNTAGQLESEGIIESSQINTPKNSGIYVLLIKNNEERYFQKLIVE